MKPSTKFALGSGAIVLAVSLLIFEGVRQTGTYFLTPSQLVARTASDPSLHDINVKVSAKVVQGSITRDPAAQRVDFTISDGTRSFPVSYTGLVPDTFTDANEIEVVAEGKFGRDGTFHATVLVAKCGSRYEAQWDEMATKAT
jgi:cytochrome c-type biogenesis protein CcmE